MYLKKLSLKGFKSFPIKTEILFEKGTTAIVGPNGSGKSNISDAIRWVLGEQSIKSLRGEKMEDVIFSGTDNKKQHNYCEVTLTLGEIGNNIDIDGDELTIKRRVYRTGESEYFINNKTCRLRDVKEIIMDTGIGKDGYSIIEQGKVEEILSPNPQNRRKVFDEACGIAKYRYKKIEAERNLSRTEENLNRIIDIFTEIEKQVGPLQKQKEKAEKYIVINDELRNYEINDIIIRNTDLENSLNDLNFQLKEISSELDGYENTKNDVEVEVNELEESLLALEKEIEEKNNFIFELNNEINENIKEKDLNKVRIKNLEHDVERKNTEINIIKKKLDLANTQLEKTKNGLVIKKKEIEEFELNIEEIIKNKDNYETILDKKSSKLEEIKSISIDLLNKKAEISNNITRYSIDLKNIDSRIAEIDKNIENLKNGCEELKISVEDKTKEYEQLLEDIQSYNENIIAKNEDIENNKHLITELNSKINKTNMDISSMKAKKNTYVDMENHHEGFNKGVREILKNKSISGIHGAFGELIKVEHKFEKAIEATLGASIQNVVVDNESIAKNAIEYLKKNNLGRVTFLPLNTIKPNEINLSTIKTKIQQIGIASNLISYGEKYSGIVKYLLGRVIIVENIDEGIQFARETANKFKVVTLDGEILNPGGSMTGGSLKSSGNILSRKRIIEDLEKDIQKAQFQNNQSIEILESKKTDIENLQSEVDSIISSKNNKEKELASLETEIKMIKSNYEQNMKNLEKEVFEKDNIDKTVNDSRIMLNSSNEELESILNNAKNNELETMKLNDEIEELEYSYNEIVKVFNEKNIELVRLKQIYENSENEINRINEEIKLLNDNEKELLDSSAKDKEEIQSLTELIDKIGASVEQKNIAFDTMKQELESMKENKHNIKGKYEEKKALFRNTERRIIEVKESKYKLDSKLERNKNSRDNLLSSLYEKYELSYVQALEFRNPNLKIDYKKMDSLRRAKKELGNVNLDSIREYEEVKERYDYYSEQKDDLEKSIVSINELIEELVKNMEIEFIEKFNEINTNFKEVYKKLFGGGNADLRLADAENVLECDIDIIAQPPGKKMKNLSLLSGGEKALTAICILFAILISKPTPFCILDEIEAPLDDVNIFRFGEYIKELSQDTQFISVTHRRGTMEVSDYIYGVTMQEKGVSSVISLNLKEAAEIAEG